MLHSKIATSKVAGVLDADALLQTSLTSIPGRSVACDHQMSDVVDVNHRCSLQRLNQP